MPEGRVAYWGDWTALGLNKPQWGAMHITGGLLFVLIGVWHAILNVRPLTHYLKKVKVENSCPAPVVMAICTIALVYLGILFQVPPIHYVMALNEAVKQTQAARYGNPPFAHAELSTLEKFCQMLQLDLDAALLHMKTASFKGDISKTARLKDIAAANGYTPQQLYSELFKAINTQDVFAALPESAPEGTGKMTLKGLCENFNLPILEAIKRLENVAVIATADETLRQIADKHNVNPHQIYALLRAGKRPDAEKVD